MSAFLNHFGSDATLEEDGVWLNFDGYRIKLAANSPNNAKLAKAIEEATYWAKTEYGVKHVNSLSRKQQLRYSAKLTAKGYVRDWETEVDGKFVKGIDLGDGIIPPTEENIENALVQGHWIIQVLNLKVTEIKLFQSHRQEEDVKN